MSLAPVHHIGIPNPLFEGDLNLYLIQGDPLTLIDTGIGTEAALVSLEQQLDALGFSVANIERIILTHKHADHIGLARTIRDRSGAPIFIHEDDWDGLAHLDDRHNRYVENVRLRLTEWGTPIEETEKLLTVFSEVKGLARDADAEKLLDGQTLPQDGQQLEIIHTPGHTQGSICIRYGRHLFSGDHVLQKISPNIGAGEMKRRGMLLKFLASLDRIAPFQTNDLVVLPGHGPQFHDLAGRITELKHHHAEREAEILKLLDRDQGKTVYEITRGLFRRLPGYHLMLGAAEVNAHLEKMVTEGAARTEDGRFFAA